VNKDYRNCTFGVELSSAARSNASCIQANTKQWHSATSNTTMISTHSLTHSLLRLTSWGS